MRNPTLPVLLKDGYKVGHKFQYPDGTSLVYSNFTPRSSRLEGVDEVVFFGLQYFIKEYLLADWQDNFFDQDRDWVVARYKRRIDNYLGPDAIPYDHIGALWDLGYLPISIAALPEGTSVPLRVPMFTIHNTHPDFFWLTNMLETIMSCTIWGGCTSATVAKKYRQVFDKYEAMTVGEVPVAASFAPWQGHDFSFRGMSSLESAMISGAAHLLSFTGTDTIPAIDFLETYYNADSDTELVGGSVPATEHSVICMGGEDGELETIERLITKVNPNGIVSDVCDTWDFWGTLTDILPKLKDKIMAREGKFVVRPDSGDPVKIICGDAEATPGSPEFKGAIEVLWDIFGGTITDKGYKLLDSHIGLIYGDSITLERQEQILSELEAKGFASYDVVLGIGSFTYQYTTRDTFGFAMKATYGVVNGEPRNIFKCPKTDDGQKFSAKGPLDVLIDDDGKLYLKDELSWAMVDPLLDGSAFREVFRDGKLIVDDSLAQIRERVQK